MTLYVQHFLCENALNGTSGLKEDILFECAGGNHSGIGDEARSRAACCFANIHIFIVTRGRRIEMIKTSAKLRELTWIYITLILASPQHKHCQNRCPQSHEQHQNVERCELEFIFSNIHIKYIVLCNLGESK